MFQIFAFITKAGLAITGVKGHGFLIARVRCACRALSISALPLLRCACFATGPLAEGYACAQMPEGTLLPWSPIYSAPLFLKISGAGIGATIGKEDIEEVGAAVAHASARLVCLHSLPSGGCCMWVAYLDV